jgi:hypothetical protein
LQTAKSLYRFKVADLRITALKNSQIPRTNLLIHFTDKIRQHILQSTSTKRKQHSPNPILKTAVKSAIKFYLYNPPLAFPDASQIRKTILPLKSAYGKQHSPNSNFSILNPYPKPHTFIYARSPFD